MMLWCFVTSEARLGKAMHFCAWNTHAWNPDTRLWRSPSIPQSHGESHVDSNWGPRPTALTVLPTPLQLTIHGSELTWRCLSGHSQTAQAEAAWNRDELSSLSSAQIADCGQIQGCCCFKPVFWGMVCYPALVTRMLLVSSSLLTDHLFLPFFVTDMVGNSILLYLQWFQENASVFFNDTFFWW